MRTIRTWKTREEWEVDPQSKGEGLHKENEERLLPLLSKAKEVGAKICFELLETNPGESNLGICYFSVTDPITGSEFGDGNAPVYLKDGTCKFEQVILEPEDIQPTDILVIWFEMK